MPPSAKSPPPFDDCFEPLQAIRYYSDLLGGYSWSVGLLSVVAKRKGITDPLLATANQLQEVADYLEDRWSAIPLDERLLRIKISIKLRQLNLKWTHPLIQPYCNQLEKVDQILDALREKLCLETAPD